MSSAQPFDLSGTCAVVTGARRGIGAAVAVALAEAGADIIGISAQMDDGGGDVGARIRDLGRSFEAIRTDFADRGAVRETAERVAALDPGVDILVNNAGLIKRSPAEAMEIDDWDHVIEVDLTAQFILARQIGGAMLERGQGKIIFTASLLSYQGGINVAAYTSAKSGVNGLTKALSNEWASRGVNVNAVVPGYIATDNTAALRADDERNAAILGRIPAGRWGSAEDMAGAYVFLASSAADYIHGASIPVDGGWLGR